MPFDLSLPSKPLTYVTCGHSTITTVCENPSEPFFTCLFLVVVLHKPGPVLRAVLLPSARLEPSYTIRFAACFRFTIKSFTCSSAVVFFIDFDFGAISGW